MLSQILLAKECLGTLVALERPSPDFVGLNVCSMRVLGCKILAADFANVGTIAGVRIHVLVQQILRAVTFATNFAGPRFHLGIVNALVNAEQPEIAEYSVADFALKVALLFGHVLV